MPAAGAYVVVHGQTYRVLDQTLDEVTAAVKQALDQGAVLPLHVTAMHNRAEDIGSGTLYLHGAQLASVGVLAGPLPQKGHATGF